MNYEQEQSTREVERAVIDACTLADFAVGDLLLRIAEETGAYRVFWSEQILEEVRRTQLVDLEWGMEATESFHRELRRTMPTSLIRGYERWLPKCANAEGDRHVLACAIEANASVIITYNERDFARSALAAWGIQSVHPQDYLLSLYEKKADAVWEQIGKIAQGNKRRGKKRVTARAVLEALSRPNAVPEFARHLLAELG